MNQTRIFLGMCLVSAAAFSWACSDDGATDPASTVDAGADPDSTANVADGAPAALGCGDAGGAPARVLVVQGNGRAGNELVAVNLTTNAVDGRLRYDGGFGVVAADGTEPYLLDETNDTVTRLDAREPWKSVATWDVHGDDGVDGGDPTANPIGLVATSCNKAYVLRYNRNKIAVIDQSQHAGGKASKYIDLSSLAQDGDPNQIDITSAVYVPAKRRVYVLVGNIDFTLFDAVTFNLNCPTKPLTPTLVAIDVDTDALVDLGGTGPGGSIALEGYNPVNTSPLVYDAAGDRVLVLNAGCTSGGSTVRRGVEEVSLTTGATQTLLDLKNAQFPSSVAFVDANHAAVAFFSDGRLWDPTQTSLGKSVPGGIDNVVTDGRGGFVATHGTTDTSGDAGLDIVTFPADGGAEVVVTSNPFTPVSGYVSGLASWPHP